jgi:hypothetical protein
MAFRCNAWLAQDPLSPEEDNLPKEVAALASTTLPSASTQEDINAHVPRAFLGTSLFYVVHTPVEGAMSSTS